MVYFTEEQITDIVSRYKTGQTLSEISSRANTIKNNATLEELQVLTANLKAKLK